MLVAEVKPIGRVADIKALYRSSGTREEVHCPF